MNSKPISSLIARGGKYGQLYLSTFVGGLVAISVPILAYLLGAVLTSLINAQTGQGGVSPKMSTWLPDIHTALPADLSPLGQVCLLLVLALLLLSAASVLLYAFYRLIQSAAVAFEVSLIAELRNHARRLATVRTLSAQQTALTDCLNYHLPRVRGSLSRWWRTFPRHLIQLVACICMAGLIQPMLTLLTLIATALVVLIYRLLDRLRRTTLPVVRERASQERESLISLTLTGPLLESVHAQSESQQRFSDQLAHYRKDAVRSLSSSAWKTPMILVVAGFLACLFLFVIAVQILRSETSFSVSGAFTFSLCFGGAAVSASRLQRSWRDLRTIETAAEEVERFLALPVEEFDNGNLATISKVTQPVVLDHVTLQDCSGRKLLENVSAAFPPGKLIGVLASQRLQARAMVELLMGYGRPVSGRLLFDGVLVSDIKPQCLTACSHWVASDGALVTGTVHDNLIAGRGHRTGPELDDAIAAARMTDALQKLPDGLATLITPNDDRFTGDAAFRLAVARASLTAASIVVIEEPESHYDPNIEQQTLEAIRGLVGGNRISVVLPQRLLTLRQCDVVLMIHDHKVADSGTHAELLQRNELYRHLNYLRFNPFRGLPE